jgi:Family of unknown function (DUF6492)
MTEGRFSFVSVVFEAELDLLRLQARSMARYVPETSVDEIIVIDNTSSGMRPAAKASLLSEYSALAPQVRLLRPSDICRVPGTTGWRSQQVLKLCVAKHINSDAYVVLDAKNHFVAPMRPEFFRAPDGRARVTAYSYRDHPLRPSLEKVLGYLSLDPEPLIDRFTATVTPFVLDTQTVRQLITSVESASKRSFAEEFVANELTEFFLYSAWVLTTGRTLADFYDLQENGCPTVWPRGATVEGVSAAIKQSQDRQAPVFAVHRKALAALTGDAASELASFWTRSGLFATTDNAERYISEFARTFTKQARIQRVRELPRRALVLSRRLSWRLRRALGREKRRVPHASA